MLFRALRAVKLTASGHICARLAAPVSLPKSDTTVSRRAAPGPTGAGSSWRYRLPTTVNHVAAM